MAFESWNEKSVVKRRISIAVVKNALPAWLARPLVSCNRLSSRSVLPLNCRPVGVLKPDPKLIEVLALVLIVNVPVATGLSVSPDFEPIALIVVVAETGIAALYTAELCVGVLLSVV